jgi:hypothetical protein
VEYHGIQKSHHSKVGISHITNIVTSAYRYALDLLQGGLRTLPERLAIWNMLALTFQANDTGKQALIKQGEILGRPRWFGSWLHILMVSLRRIPLQCH